MPRVSEPLIVLTTILIKETITNSYQDAEKFTREYYQAAEQFTNEILSSKAAHRRTYVYFTKQLKGPMSCTRYLHRCQEFSKIFN